MTSARWRTIGLGATAFTVIVALLAAQWRGVAMRAYTTDIPDANVVALLHPGQEACAGPIAAAHAYDHAGVWVNAPTGPATLHIVVRRDDGTELATSHPVATGSALTEPQPRLSRLVRAGTAATVCVHTDTGVILLWGSASAQPAVKATGMYAGDQFSLVLIRDQPGGSLLQWLPTVFARAALWRPGWVGSWTFWLLALGVLGAFGLGAGAVSSAAAGDEQSNASPAAAGDLASATRPAKARQSRC